MTQANLAFRTNNTTQRRFEKPSSREEFDVAIVCALQRESDAVEACVDEFWDEDGEVEYGKSPGDPNSYTLGRIDKHNVVIAYMPGMGKGAAASCAASFRASFPNIRLGLIVGICGGVPQLTEAGPIVFLGDAIVSTNVVQYDLGRQYSDRMIRKDTLEDNLGRPNSEIRGFLRQLQGWRLRSRLQDALLANITEVTGKRGFEGWSQPSSTEDQLYRPGYRHKHQNPTTCFTCSACVGPDDAVCDEATNLSCRELGCDDGQTISLEKRLVGSATATPRNHTQQGRTPEIHFGSMASGDTVIKSSLHRDQIAKQENVLGFEMEAAGVWDSFPTIVIKGVCDYADSHKNKRWQNFASVTAAACTKAILREWRGIDKDAAPSRASGMTNQNITDAAGEQTTFNFNNQGPVHTQSANQTFNGPVHHAPVYNYSAGEAGTNFGSQVGFNFGSIQNNDYRNT